MQRGNDVIECVHCERKFIPSKGDIDICPYCGHATGEGLLHLSSEEDLPEADQFSENSLTRTMGKVALLGLILIVFSFLLYGFLTPPISSSSLLGPQ